MCPGGDDASLDMVLPLLRLVAAKDKKGNPCVGKAGSGGSGHYVKMIHNGIEHGMMSAIAEAWQIMDLGLEMDEDEIGNTLEKWNEKGQLVGFKFVVHALIANLHSTEPSSSVLALTSVVLKIPLENES